MPTVRCAHCAYDTYNFQVFQVILFICVVHSFNYSTLFCVIISPTIIISCQASVCLFAWHRNRIVHNYDVWHVKKANTKRQHDQCITVETKQASAQRFAIPQPITFDLDAIHKPKRHSTRKYLFVSANYPMPPTINYMVFRGLIFRSTAIHECECCAVYLWLHTAGKYFRFFFCCLFCYDQRLFALTNLIIRLVESEDGGGYLFLAHKNDYICGWLMWLVNRQRASGVFSFLFNFMFALTDNAPATSLCVSAGLASSIFAIAGTASTLIRIILANF